MTTTAMARVLATAGLTGAAVLHAAWAAGSSWPAADDRELAELVTGSGDVGMPPRAASLAVAVVLGAAAVASSGPLAGGRTGRPIRAVRVVAASGLLGRAAVGGVVACRLLRLPEPAERFRELDRRWYRPVCAVLGLSLLLGG